MMSFFWKIALSLVVLLDFWACTQDGDGPLELSSTGERFAGKGFFRYAVIDEDDMVYLVGDTLHLRMDSIWTFSNCSLDQIQFVNYKRDSVFFLYPVINLVTSNEDCAAPYYRPDTTVNLILKSSLLEDVSVIKVRNDLDSVMDSILVRRGEFLLDTFDIYVDSIFDATESLPLRTKGSPSVFKVLDSLTERTFLWRSMKTECSMRIDMCDSLVADTLYPSTWRMNDTNLVPIRMACADSDLVYCHSSYWENDSSSLGKVQVRHDTLWHTSLYYVEPIPECGTVVGFSWSNIVLDAKTQFIRKLFSPDESELSCGPSARKDLFIYDLGRKYAVPDSVDTDSLFARWKSAKVAPTKKKK